MDTKLTSTRVHEPVLELKLKHAEKAVDELGQEANTRQSGYTEILSRVRDAELVQRRDHGPQRRLKLAHFPFQKTRKPFDFGLQPSLDQRQVEELATLNFVAEGSDRERATRFQVFDVRTVQNLCHKLRRQRFGGHEPVPIGAVLSKLMARWTEGPVENRNLRDYEAIHAVAVEG